MEWVFGILVILAVLWGVNERGKRVAKDLGLSPDTHSKSEALSRLAQERQNQRAAKNVGEKLGGTEFGKAMEDAYWDTVSDYYSGKMEGQKDTPKQKANAGKGKEKQEEISYGRTSSGSKIHARIKGNETSLCGKKLKEGVPKNKVKNDDLCKICRNQLNP